MTSEQFGKLNELFKMLEVKGSTNSEKWRNFIDKLHELLVSQTSVEVSHKPVTTEASEIPECLSRYEDEGEYFCVNRKAHGQKLETLKICSKCQWRLTELKVKKEGLYTQTRNFVTCGAREHYDQKKGLMLYCNRKFNGLWITMKTCETRKCEHLKKVQTT